MEVVIYTYPACTRCKTLKMLLDKYNVKYKDISHTECDINGEYPHIFLSGNKIAYHIFLRMLKKGDIE